MPKNAPLGEVQLTVTYQDRISEPYKLTAGRRQPRFLFNRHRPRSVAGGKEEPEAAPGSDVTLWSTGVSGKSLDLVVGGKPAEDVRVAAVACCLGVQQVTFRVPAGTPLGCFVPAQARTRDGRPSNAIPIAVHAPGEVCRDQFDWFRESVEKAKRAGFVALARVSIDMHIAPRIGSEFQFDYGIASFGRQESGQREFPPLPPARTCTVFTARLNLRQILGQSRHPGGMDLDSHAGSR